MILSQIVGWGEYLPEKVLTNDNLSETIETSDEWIFPRTGIKQRHIALKKELTSDLAINAAKEAFVNSTICPSDIDCVIVATTTPDDTFPSTATKVQHFFKMKNTPAFDIQAVCSGFIYSLQVADTFLKCGNAKNILAIGAETRNIRYFNVNEFSEPIFFVGTPSSWLTTTTASAQTKKGQKTLLFHAAIFQGSGTDHPTSSRNKTLVTPFT